MTLSRNYIIRLVIGWTTFGGASYLFGYNCIGGAATFFLLVAFASWSLFPLLHFTIAALTARKIKQDPSSSLSASLVFGVVALLILLISSGLFNYV